MKKPFFTRLEDHRDCFVILRNRLSWVEIRIGENKLFEILYSFLVSFWTSLYSEEKVDEVNRAVNRIASKSTYLCIDSTSQQKSYYEINN